MATQRFGYLDDFTQKDNNVGIGTSTPQERLEIIGGTRSGDLRVAGIATLTSAGGFIEKHIEYAEDEVKIDAGDSRTLSNEVIVGSGKTIAVGTASTAGQGSVKTLKVYNMFKPPSGFTNQRPVGKPGSLFYNFDYKTIEFFNGNDWVQVDNLRATGRGLFGGGTPSAIQYAVNYVNIATRGNSTHWGDMRNGRYVGQNSVGGDTRVIFVGGYSLSPAPETGNLNAMDYGTIAAGGQCVDFGNLTRADRSGGSGSNSTRGIYWGGQSSPNQIIDYFHIHTLGNALQFVDLGGDPIQGNMCQASPTKLVRSPWSDTSSSGNLADIASLKFSSLGSVTDFGEATRRVYYCGTASNGVRGIFAGGANRNTPSPYYADETGVQFFTFASEGNAIDFGDLKQSGAYAGASSKTRGVFSSFYPQTPGTSHMESIEISSDGNGIDFGDGADHFASGIGASDCHGGLGGF